MAQEPLAQKGNYLHIYDFRVQKGREEEFIRSFETFDYSDGNPMHKSKAQVKDGVLCREGEYDAAVRRDIELPEPVFRLVEVLGHSALAADAALERHADQIAVQVIGPLVIGADKLARGAGQFAAELGSAMGAAVLDHADRAVLRARDDDWRRTNVRADEVAGIGNLGFERDVVPRWAVKNAFDLTLIDGLVRIDPVGNFGEVARPNILLLEENRFVGSVFGSIAARAIAHAALHGACAVSDVI